MTVSVFLLGAFAGKCVAPQTPKEPLLREREPIAESYLHKRLALWQDRLNLQDWKIKIIQSHPSSLRAGTLGNIHWDADEQTAVIRVLDASDYQLPMSGALKDMEFTVVHELVHLELSSLTKNFKSRSEESYSGEEQAVNRMADALLKLDNPAR
jgi:hypothetical protein